MKKNLRNNIYLLLLFFFVTYLFLSFFFNVDYIEKAISLFAWKEILPILFFLVSSLILKYFRWVFYLKKSNVDVSPKVLFLIFVSSLSFSVTPGKMGDFIKAYMIKDYSRIELKKTFPSILAERIIESISLIIIVISGLNYLESNYIILVISILLFSILFIIILNNRIRDSILMYLGKINLFKKYINNISTTLKGVDKLFEIAPFISMLFFSIIIWGFEFLLFFWILNGLNLDVSFLWSQFVYSFSMLVGSVSFLPAGLGVTDGSLYLLMQQKGISTELSFIAPVLMRVFVLWIPILLGSVAIIWFNKIINANKKK